MNFLITITLLTFSVSHAGYYEAYSNYLQQLGLTDLEGMSTNNSGLNDYNQKLVNENPCFDQLVQKFYNNIHIKDKIAVQQFPTRTNDLFNNLLSSTESSSHTESGWLWKEALKISSGNPNLAMMLIGSCGHDDAMSFIPNRNPESKQQCEVYKILGTKITEYKSSIYSPSDCSSEEIELMGYNKSICPAKASTLFLPGALGKETILAPQLIEQISKIQAPNRGGDQLPAKYYHTIGSAYLTCQLKISGVSKSIAMATQLKMIRAYRHRRLCQEEVYNKSVNDFQYTHTYISSHQLSFEQFVDQLLKNKLEGRRGRKAQAEWSTILKRTKDSKELLVLLSKKIARIDATDFLKTFVYTNSLCLVSSESSTQTIKSIIDDYSPYWISAERLQASKTLLSTWWIDIVWSQEQHRLGVEFAYEHCEQNEDFLKNLDSLSCKALSM